MWIIEDYFTQPAHCIIDKKYPLRQKFQLIRDIFESNDVKILRWVSTANEISDILTKRKTYLKRDFNIFFSNGKLTLTNNDIRQKKQLRMKMSR